MNESSNIAGVLGDGALRPGKYNLRLVRQAISGGWNVKPDVKERIVKQLARVVDESDDDGNIIAASRTLIMADAADLKKELAAESAEMSNGSTTNNFNGPVQVNVVAPVQEAMKQPEYLEYLETRALAEDSDPGVVRTNGKRGPVENGQALNGHQPGTNGKHH